MTITIDWFNVLLYGVVTFVAALAALGVVQGIAALRGRRAVRHAKKRHGWPEKSPPAHAAPPAQAPVDFEDHATQAMRVAQRKPRARGSDLLAPPPMIDGVSLYAYLRHHSTRKCPHLDANGRAEHAGTLTCVVEDLYTTALDSPLAHYFDGVDLSPLKRHFLSALITLTDKGLTVDVAERLQAKHAHLGIDQADFSLVVKVLVDSIGTYTTAAVMQHVLPQMDGMVVELKNRIVTA
jgi:hypothetical protein